MQDGLHIEAVMRIEIGDAAALSEMLDAERRDTMAINSAEP